MITDWHDFFFAAICATGSLLGLLFVAISISISKITSSADLSKAAVQPLLILLTILVSSIYFLIPEQALWLLGAEVSVTALAIGTVMAANDISVYRRVPSTKRNRYFSNIIFNLLPAIFVVCAGVAIVTTGEVGVYAMVPAVAISFIQVGTISWALLVEIHLHGEIGSENERWTGNVDNR